MWEGTHLIVPCNCTYAIDFQYKDCLLVAENHESETACILDYELIRVLPIFLARDQ